MLSQSPCYGWTCGSFSRCCRIYSGLSVNKTPRVESSEHKVPRSWLFVKQVHPPRHEQHFSITRGYSWILILILFCCFKREKYFSLQMLYVLFLNWRACFLGGIKRKKPLGLIEVMYISEPIRDVCGRVAQNRRPCLGHLGRTPGPSMHGQYGRQPSQCISPSI